MKRFDACAVRVLLARLEEDTITGADDLDRVTAALGKTDSLEDVDRLAVRMRVPRRSRAGREMDAARAHTRGVGQRRNRVDVHRACEPLSRTRSRLDAVSRDLHDFS